MPHFIAAKRCVAAGMLLAACMLLLPHGRADAAVADWQQSVTIFARWDADFSSDTFRESVRRASETGANMITLHIPLYQYNSYTTEIWTGWNTPTDASLRDGIRYIHSLGMSVMLKFQVIPYDGQWSAYINPGDRDAWFGSYTNMLLRYARIAAEEGVAELCLGTELISMTSEQVNASNTWRWQNLIAAVRGVYGGRLTYSANWGAGDFENEKAHINFWSSLDDIGVAGYFNLWGDGSVEQLKEAWHHYNMNDLKLLHERWGKPIMFTEVGYKSIRDSYQHPWNYWANGGADPEQQARDYEALFQYWNDYPYMRGVHWWFWSSDPDAGGWWDTDYTPQGKAAIEVMKRWFGAGAPAPVVLTSAPGTTSPHSMPVFRTEMAAVNPRPPMGQEVAFSFTVFNDGGAIADAVIDAEIYDAGGTRVFQQFFEQQSFGSGSSRPYTVRWTPVAAGTYILKIGAFSSGWQQNYYWLDEAARAMVGQQAAIDIWWPSDGTAVSGIQPFKALVRDMAVGDYAMYWQVDGGALNVMPTDNTDYPHKETLVDLALWTWREDGRYPVTFIAKDNTGATIGERQVSVQVFHY